MPRSETILQVFVASPCDVRDEREILESVIIELNRTWSKTLGIRLDLIRWETATHPAIDSDPQSVINSQIGDEYDIFIGILWGRIGTATPRSASGTLEEFERAHSRWKTDPNGLEIMFYFKDAPIRPSESDGQQIENVQALKRSLGEKGIYHWTFEGTENFESAIRAHLSAVAQRWDKKESLPIGREESNGDVSTEHLVQSEPDDSEDDLGLLDYLDRYNLSMEQMNAGLHAVADATISVGEQMNRRTTEIQEIGDLSDPQRYKDARRTIKASAEDMNRFADILDGQMPLVASSRKEAFESLSRALSLYGDFDNDRSEIEKLYAILQVMIEAAGSSLEGMGGFRQSVRNFPRLTSDINKAKRRVTKALDEFISEVETTINTAKSLLGSPP